MYSKTNMDQLPVISGTPKQKEVLNWENIDL